MPRAPRILIEGGLYHVYNRFARGENVFANTEETIKFLDLLRDLKQRDDFQVFAWSLLSNHYHLAIRTSAVPLSRTMRTLQGGFSKAFNRRWKRTGPLWQSRYQARLVDNQRYFEKLVFYIHLNSVRAGLVDDPVKHVFSGHREIMGMILNPLLDVDDALLSFGSTAKTARRTYLRRLNAALAAEQRAEVPDRLPWWTPEKALKPTIDRSSVDELGRSTGRERRLMEAREFVDLVCSGLDTTIEILASSRKDRGTTMLHQLFATVGIERWRQSAGMLASVLEKHPDVISRWARTGGKRRSIDATFKERLDELDDFLTKSPPQS